MRAVSFALAVFLLYLAVLLSLEARRGADAELERFRETRAATVRQARRFIGKLEQTPRAEWTDVQRQNYEAALKALADD